MSEERVSKVDREIPGGCNVGCGSCAFRAGSETRFEPIPVLESEFCVLGGVPFFCHYDKAGRDFHASDDKPKGVDLVVCEGWKAAVREASRDPRWHNRRHLRRAYAEIGLDSLKLLTAEEDAGARKQLLKQIKLSIDALLLPAKPSVEAAKC